MQVKRELWQYGKNEKVWVGKYRNSHNLPHWHYDCELIFLERGRLEVFCNQKHTVLEAEQAYLIESGLIHHMRALEETVLEVIIFDYDLIRPFGERLSLVSPLLSRGYDIPALYAMLFRELFEKKKLYTHRVNLAVASKLCEIYSAEPTCEKVQDGRATENFKRLLSKIETDIEFLTFEEAAKYMNMNPAYFSRLFHSLAGMPFSAYLNCVRVDKALELIKGGEMQMTEIAAKSGFATIRSFNRVFKQLTGFSPSDIPRDFLPENKLLKLDVVGEDPTLVGCELIESC